jgi:hypothetical protein
MPAVAAALTAKFGWEPKLSDPNQSVAKGAAIYGALARAERESVSPKRFARVDLARTRSRDRNTTVCRVERVGGQPITLSIDDTAQLPMTIALDTVPGTGPIRVVLEVVTGEASCHRGVKRDSSAVAATLPAVVGKPLNLCLDLDDTRRVRLTAGLGALTAEFVVGEPHSKVVR